MSDVHITRDVFYPLSNSTKQVILQKDVSNCRLGEINDSSEAKWNWK